MNVGDYVRTKEGIIDKVIIDYNGHCANPNCNCKHISCVYNYYDEDTIVKSSPNIIDLIEVGDYVNGYKVDFIQNNEVIFNGNHPKKINMFAEDIESILTHEQLASIEYKVRD